MLTTGLIVELHPFLFHVTFSTSVERIQREGLTCAASLKRCFPAPSAATERIRPAKLELSQGVTLNDQVPMLPPVWKQCKLPDGYTPEGWVDYLDKHVFFWTNEKRLHRFLSVREKRGYQSTVFRVVTKDLLEVFEGKVLLSGQNTGGPYPPNPPPRELFSRIVDFPFEEIRKKGRTKAEAIVELVLEGQMDKPELLSVLPKAEWP